MVLLSLLAVLEIGEDRPVASVAWLALGPLVASLLLTSRWTAVVAAYSLLLGGMVVAFRPGSGQTVTVQLLVLAGLAGFAVGNCLLRERRERHLRAVLRVAQVAQAAILQPVPSRTGRFAFGSRYLSSDSHSDVAGDVVDVQATGRGARILVGDVDGRGLSAVPLASIMLASFREACEQPGVSLLEVARAVDHAVALLGAHGQSATAIIMDVDDRGWAEVVNCGHPPPLRRDADGRVTSLSPQQYATPLGRAPELHSDTFTLTPQDRLVLYTDGLLESRDGAGQMLPLDRQLSDLDEAEPAVAAGQLLDGTLRRRGRGNADDAAVLVVDFNPATR
jgi:phosphoserine phosphatase RsbU/P